MVALLFLSCYVMLQVVFLFEQPARRQWGAEGGVAPVGLMRSWHGDVVSGVLGRKVRWAGGDGLDSSQAVSFRWVFVCFAVTYCLCVSCRHLLL